VLAEQYERLRRAALGQGAPASREGFAILIREGMAAWIQACASLLLQVTSPQPPRGALALTAVEGPLQADLVSVLATMAVVAGE
jgi:hypothetical protein